MGRSGVSFLTWESLVLHNFGGGSVNVLSKTRSWSRKIRHTPLKSNHLTFFFNCQNSKQESTVTWSNGSEQLAVTDLLMDHLDR